MTSDAKMSDAARKRMLAEHKEITELTHQLTEAEPDQLSDCLQQLRPLLERHFAAEESEIDGLHSGIRERTPEHYNALLELKTEHEALLDRMRQLIDGARGDPDTTRLRDLCHQLRAELEAHEAKETVLFLDSMWTDTGGGD